MQLRKISLCFILFCLLVQCFAEVDSDNDMVPDEHELLDKTDPNNAADNALVLKIRGEIALDKTIFISVEHPDLGKMKGVEFSIKTKSKITNLNSANLGEVEYKIEESGIHYISAKKGNFYLMQYIIPACGYEQKEKSFVPLAVLLTVNFTNIIVALIFFVFFMTLLKAYFTDSEDIAALIAGFGAFSIFYANYSLLLPILAKERLVVQAYLLVEFLFGLFATNLVKTSAAKRIAEKEVLAADRKPFSFGGLFANLFIWKRDLKAKKVFEMKKDIAKTKAKLGNAIIEARAAESKEVIQEKMGAISEHIENLQKNLIEAKLMKDEAEKKEAKTIDDLRTEKELELMIEDISKVLASELQISELPEKIEPIEEKKGFFSFLKLNRRGELKKLEKANVCISLSDVYGQALNASNASFFIGANEVKPVKILAERAYFYFTETVVELYVRYLGYTDAHKMIETSDSMGEVEIKMKHSLLLKITDAAGKELRDVFITITDDSGKKVEDIQKNSIWKTPCPMNASDGTAAIALNPANLRGKMLKVNVVRAGFKNAELLIPSSKISTEEQTIKAIMLERAK
ncbi:MAG: hypothetical protein N3F05_00535 [Candidatus Diapherotrites archaeon]|nr:hypothetical protein [Candidatus Diapherotrites archaeon]